MTDGLVTREDLERSLERVRALAPSPEAGIYGPDSMQWRVGRHGVLFMGAGRAALLQLAHPYVAHGVDQHSKTRTDPFGRFRRTFYHVLHMIFGDLESAFRAARVVHAIHTRIEGPIPPGEGDAIFGPRYRANEPEALLWVHATLLDTSIFVFERVVRPLSDDEKARYYEESKRFGYLFGIGDDVLPADWPAFQAYMERMLAPGALHVSTQAREMARFLLTPMHPVLTPIMHNGETVTAWMMPEHLADGFGLRRRGRLGRAEYVATLRAARAAEPRLPRRLRFNPVYFQARRRLAGATKPDPLGDWMIRTMIGRTAPRAPA